jgi:hypothetical protein
VTVRNLYAFLFVFVFAVMPWLIGCGEKAAQQAPTPVNTGPASEFEKSTASQDRNNP